MTACKFDQRKYTPKHPEKYKGNPSEIYMRSSWETQFAIWADSNPAILQWSSETVVIPYFSPLDGKSHRYFVDFWIKVKTSKGGTKTYLVEIKPYCQCIPPVITPRKKKRTILTEQSTYVINQAKWEAARKYASGRGWDFVVITEKHLFGK